MNRKYFTACISLFFICLALKSNAQYLQFIENKGQWDKSVKFKANFNGNDLALQPNGYKVILRDKDDLKRISDFFGGHVNNSADANNADTGKAVSMATAVTIGKAGNTASAIKDARDLKLHCHAYQVSFLNADSNAVAEPDKPLNTYNNYFIGSDSTKWATGCKVYNGVTYKNVYKNVDVRYYSDNGNLKYDIIIKPGADISKIALKFAGLSGLVKNKYGNLTMHTSLGDIFQSIPSSYQVIKGLKNKVKAAFDIQGDEVHFKLGDYDKNSTIIIDPTEIFASFVGSTCDDWGYTATYDNAGDLYAGGIAFDNGFVNRGLGGYDITYNGGDGSEGAQIACDISIIKFNPNGSLALYATYLGGSGDEQPHSLIVDSRGNLIVAGRTTSVDFPVTAPTFGKGGGFDIILAKLSADGKTLLASRKFGGSGSDGVNIAPKYANQSVGTPTIRRNYGDDARSEVITDNNDNIYLASCTQSGDFPVTANAFKKSLGGTQDGVFIKASTDLNTIYNSTYLGGSDQDAAFVVTISKTTGNIYIGGGTTSKDMAANASNAPQGIIHSTYQNGNCDGFITELSADANTLIKTVYVGTSGDDLVYGVQTDKFGYPYIMGTTTQTFPVYKSPFNANGNQANGKQFITKLSPDLTQVLYNANFGKGGGTPDISPTAFLVDICGNVYVSGWGGKANFEYIKNTTLVGMPTTANAISRTTDGNDFYFFVLEKDALSQLFGSFFGTNDPNAYGDHVDGGTSRFDRRGVIYQAVCANCGKTGIFPTTTGSWSPGNPAETGAKCNEAAVKIAFELSGVIASIRSSINGVIRDSVGCIPLTVDFADTIALGKKYVWSFGDGSPDLSTTMPNTSHTYNNIGDYHVRLISIDSSSCNTADTAYLIIKARSNKADLGFTIAKLPPCQSFNYNFTNTSTPPAGSPFGPNDFTWDFGDGTTLVSNAATVQHSYSAPGTYNVKLYLSDTTYCNSPDSVVQQLRVSDVLLAQFETPAIGCSPYNAVFNNTSLGGQQFLWDFGDGTTSTDAYPTHLYQNPGTYTVRLTATDNSTCNPTDDTTGTVTVVEGPTASFSVSPTEPKENTPFEFTNLSTNAVRYKWDFGDGDTLATTNQLPVSHLFNLSDTFNVCLIAFNANGCTDTSCQRVAALISPLADVPNAFSPNGDGINDVISVNGYGVAKMTWSIYNRWGQLVFISTNISNGWDGRYKGVLQPQDVYAYTLSITFTDNTALRKKGDITLLR